ncbi:hypothetical protein BN996_01004 [Haloferax massiliensis]|uniref:Uncharacterized protein n=1 Tax=Haloferax massiliensis TaxID=1476858 RepID=A0A0D6JNQ5_9EURY|nr:hypothetical protein BN996_01004 [Haloferax massiliensis]
MPGWSRSVETSRPRKRPATSSTENGGTANRSSNESRRAGQPSREGVSKTSRPPPSTAPATRPSAFAEKSSWASRTMSVRVVPRSDEARFGSTRWKRKPSRAVTNVTSSSGTSAPRTASKAASIPASRSPARTRRRRWFVASASSRRAAASASTSGSSPSSVIEAIRRRGYSLPSVGRGPRVPVDTAVVPVRRHAPPKVDCASNRHENPGAVVGERSGDSRVVRTRRTALRF